jgi:2-polyprenyl-6-methoxyphenol hydroxylase-like FAD-dependent oxidoreductase
VPVETEVLIVGAGPVGLTLAINLGQRGTRCALIERNEAPSQLPKMERCNARTMEIYRRLGIAETIRDAGLPREAPMDVFLATSMVDPPIVHLPYPSVAEAKADIAAHNDGRPLEPLSADLAIHARAALEIDRGNLAKRDRALRL